MGSATRFNFSCAACEAGKYRSGCGGIWVNPRVVWVSSADGVSNLNNDDSDTRHLAGSCADCPANYFKDTAGTADTPCEKCYPTGGTPSSPLTYPWRTCPAGLYMTGECTKASNGICSSAMS